MNISSIPALFPAYLLWSLLFFFIDLIALYVFTYPFVQLQLALFSILLFRKTSAQSIFFTFFMICFEQFFLHGSLQKSLFTTIYASCWLIPVFPFLNRSLALFSYLFAMLFTIIQYFVANKSFFLYPATYQYTASKLCVTLISVWIMLKYMSSER